MRDRQDLEQHRRLLEGALDRFHRDVRTDPGRWHDRRLVGTAWSTTHELDAVERNLAGIDLQDTRKLLAARERGETAEELAPTCLHQLRAAEAEGTITHALNHLRQLTSGSARHSLDLRRDVLLCHLLETLHARQPEVAEEIWQSVRKARTMDHVPGYAERWEDRTIGVLLRLLEPILEAEPEKPPDAGEQKGHSRDVE